NKYVTISKSAVIPKPTASSYTEMKQVPMYCKDKLVCGDSEMSLEEFRAILYKKKSEQRRKMQQWEEEEKKYEKEEEALREHMLKQRMEQLSSLLNVQVSASKTSPELNKTMQPVPACNTAPLGLEAPILPVQTMSSLYQVPVAATSNESVPPPLPQTSPCLGIALNNGQTNGAPVGHQLSMLSATVQHVNSIIERRDPVPQQTEHVALADRFIKPAALLERSASTIPDAPKALCSNSSALVVKLQPGVREATVIGNSSGLANTSHVTPNTSVGFVQATPSKVLPSPTVNTQEALGFIMDFFQTSTLPDDEEDDDDTFQATHPNKPDIEALCLNDSNTNPGGGGFLGLHNVAPSMPPAFCIFEDDTAKVNGGTELKPVELRSFGERPVHKPALKNEEVRTTESLVDDCTIWHSRCNKTLAPSPNSTGDFALAARLASTPASVKPSEQTCKILEDKENVVTTVDDGCHMAFDCSEDKMLQPSKIRKLSPIQEFSPKPSMIAVGVKSPSSFSTFPLQDPQLAVEIDDIECTGKRLAACKLSDTLQHSAQNVEDPWGVTTKPFIVCDDEEEPEQSIQKPEQVIVKNPWDDNLIANLLSQLPTPLTSLGNYHQWGTNVPSFKLKTQVKLDSQLFSIDHLIGEGAFAHVYQASRSNNETQSNWTVILKVQKPAKPWEFYVGTQITQRMKPELRHLYISFQSAHVFQNASVLEGELYTFGTLLVRCMA
ncbi:hypothetical protein GDO78_009790, partial [Eleutherodactylus coqui]